MKYCSNVLSRGGKIWGSVLLGLWFSTVAEGATYFVNDLSTTGDVYTAAIGSDANSGTSSNAPKLTLTNLMATYTLGAGDVVYIDTGVYTGAVTISSSHFGNASNRVFIQGSTNLVAGGTQMTAPGSTVFTISGSFIELRDLTLRNSSRGAFWNGAVPRPSFNRVRFIGNTRGVESPGGGNHQVFFSRCLFVTNSIALDPHSDVTGYSVIHSVFWSNTTIFARGSSATNSRVDYSVLVGGTVFGGNRWFGDYNVFWNTSLKPNDLSYLHEFGEFNTYADPRFADPANLNFYPKSIAGRFDPVSGNIVTDAVHSILIDYGNPQDLSYTNEPSLNGGRVNIGLFGGTTNASQSRSDPWLSVLTFNDGGAATGSTVTLRWNAGGFSSELVNLHYSTNLGTSWSAIATNIPATNQFHEWEVTSVAPGAALWRVMSVSDTNVYSISRQRFSLGGQRVDYYLNDQSLSGDFYTTATGSSTNHGQQREAPKLEIIDLFQSYNLGAYDIVYIDAGVYSNDFQIIPPSGSRTGRFVIQGVTGIGPAESVLDRLNQSGVGIDLSSRGYVELRNVTIRRAQYGINFTSGGSPSNLFFSLRFRMNSVGIFTVGGTLPFTIERCFFESNTTGLRLDSSGHVISSSIFWSNNVAIQLDSGSGGGISLNNSVIVGGTSFGGSSPFPNGDFNVFWNTLLRSSFPTLDSIQRGLSRFIKSSVLDPRFVDPANGNFFPMSTTFSGRYDMATGLWTNDAVHSPLIDFGDPVSTLWTNEPSPNGGRINIGAYGGTTFASKSRTNIWLQTLSLNDGGLINAGSDLVYWNYGNTPSGATVRVEFSFNSGFTWTALATNIAATNGSYLVSNTNFPSSSLGRWRVVLESNTNVMSANGKDFIFKNGSFVYYVNDISTNGDVYCTAPGSNLNPGTTPDAPFATLRSALSNRTFIAGDIIYVDTGVYEDNVSTSIPLLASGTNGNPVIIQGSTNVLAGGSVIRGPATAASSAGLSFDSTTSDVLVRDLVIQRRTTGISFNNNARIELLRVRIESNSVSGITASGVDNLLIRNSAIRANSQQGLSISGAGSASIINSVIWMNGLNAVQTTGTRVMITNSVLGARGALAHVFNTPTPSNIVANYNAYRVEQSASVASVGGIDRLLNTLYAWQAETGMDRMSLDIDPLFLNAGAGDFRLPSAAIQGRYDPVLGWVTDANSSPLIDAGDPSAAFGDEASPNGGRVNIGLLGNTQFASKTEPLPRLYAGNLNQGGWVRGTSTLHWVAAAIPTNETVSVDYSPDGGESWTGLATGVLASAESYAWNTTTYPATVAGLWRVTLESNPAVTSQTTNFFGIRNQPLTYYVNASSTNQTVFTSGPGAATNWVATTNRPINSLATVFNRYDLEPGDRIFVDRGTYSLAGAPIVISSADSGAPTSGAVQIIGAVSCGGAGVPVAEFVGSGGVNNSGFLMDDASFVTVSNILIRQAGAGLRASRTAGLRFDGLHITGSATNGVILMNSSNIVFERSRFSGNASYGWSGFTNANTRLINSLVYSNQAGAVFVQSGQVGITNSVLMTSGAGTRLIQNAASGRIVSDYNNLLAQDGADVALYDGRLHKFPTGWSEATTNDVRSLAHEPGFVDLAAGNFHLRSTAGRWDKSTCSVLTDAVSSVMIDAGDPASGFSLESLPNGGRINLGLYGNTPFASLSLTNARLLTASLNSGGTVRGTNVFFYWQANPVASNLLVYIDLSFDNGVTWTNIATNISASTGSIAWNSTVAGSRPLVYWRVTSQSEPPVSATNQFAFTINNGSIPYYVNDANTNGDVYALAPGSAGNDGLSPLTPVNDVASIFSRYQPGAGDVIYIDTGNYTFSAAASLTANNSGHPTNPVVIRGSTNWVAGGTRINMNRSGPLFSFNGGTSYRISDLTMTNGRQGFLVQRSTNVWFERVTYDGATNFADQGTARVAGFLIEGSTNVSLDRIVVKGVTNRAESAGILIKAPLGGSAGPNNAVILNSVMWSNTFSLWVQSASTVAMSNSIIQAGGAGSVGLQIDSAVTFRSDYNNYRITQGGRLGQSTLVISTNTPAISMPLIYENLDQWTKFTGQDGRSLIHDPLFADPANLDFSLLSAAGRWTPAGLTNDAVTSPLIDAGNPAWSFGAEPDPNGGRVNMGIFGNNARASLSPTNPAVFIASCNDGGVVRGTNVSLRWNARGNIGGLTATIRLSSDNGFSWSTLATGVLLSAQSYTWNTTNMNSVFGLTWGLMVEQLPGIHAQSDRTLDVRNSTAAFYVNDGSTDGDVYATEPGNISHTGLTPSDPLPGLTNVLERYDLEPGDVIYVDTGSYSAAGGLRVTYPDSGDVMNPVRIVGSTNIAAGGTVLTDGGLSLEGVVGVSVENVTIRGIAQNGFQGFRVAGGTNITARSLRIIGAGDGISLSSAVDVRFRNTLVLGSATNGIGSSAAGQFMRGITFEQGIIWTNGGRAVVGLADINISNSVLAASGTGRFIFGGSSNRSFRANYNFYVLLNGARIASMTYPSPITIPKQFSSLASWQAEFGQDMNSQLGDPLFADLSALDFHPKSTGGRWEPATSEWVIDPVTSPLVDAGAPGAPFAHEPELNGGRVNIGLYGDTGEASKSPVGADLLTGNLNDGGSVSGTNVLLYWIPRGNATGHAVRVEFSLDDGVTWTVLATNVPPGTFTMPWNTTLYSSTVLARWRVTSEVDPALSTTNATSFAVRNGPISFYINDASTNGLVYTTAAGSPSANGITPSTPLNSLTTLLSRYDLEPGDLVYMDTGVYTNTQTIVVDQLDAGFELIGSTNTVAGGTQFIFDGPTTGIRLLEAPATSMKHLRISGVSTAISVENSDDAVLEGIMINGGGTGISVSSSPRTVIRNSSVRNAGTGISLASSGGSVIEHVVLWSNTVQGINVSGGSASLQNSVIGNVTSNRTAIQLGSSASITSDYNLFDIRSGGLVARQPISGLSFDMHWERVAVWSRATGNDLNSLGGDPGFYDSDNGDFHPVSQAGRFELTTGNFINDTNTSVLIDAGFPLSAFSRETGDNGRRANIGMYGNTPEASRTPNNGRLTIGRFNDAGRAEGSAVYLSWRAAGAATGHFTRVEVSFDNGASWTTIQSNLVPGIEGIFWNSGTNTAWLGRWRVTSQNDPAIAATNREAFTVRNAPLSLYVNDSSLVGDVYTATAGHLANTGTTLNDPRADIQSLLDDYDLEPGDTIYVDTGNYTISSAIEIGRYDAWNAFTNQTPLQAGGTSIRIQGSTNEVAGGTTITRTGSGAAFSLNTAAGVHFADLQVVHATRGGGNSLTLQNSPYALVEWSRFRNGTRGVSLNQSESSRLRHVVIRDKTVEGLLVDNKSTNTFLGQSVLWSNLVAATVQAEGHLRARNNAVIALGAGATGWRRNANTTPTLTGYLDADFNLVWSSGGANLAKLVGSQFPGGERNFERLFNWQSFTGLDQNSLTEDPKFADAVAGDFHPQSPFGRFLLGTGYVTNLADALSPLIDAGDPAQPFSLEPAPNGGKSDIGLYGNTAQASRSATNGLLQVLTFNDGGSSAGEINLRWSASGLAAAGLVRLEFSRDGGTTWELIDDNISASLRSYLWDSVPYGAAVAGRWRITSLGDPSLLSTNEQYFALRQGGSIPYYVNDASTVGDVYTTQPGSDSNDGFLPATPKATLQNLLAEADLEPGDIVYMDTGVYSLTTNIFLDAFDTGSSNAFVTILGSTSSAGGGTILQRTSTNGPVFVLNRAENVVLENMTLQGGSAGLHMVFSDRIHVEGATVRSNAVSGLQLSGSREAIVRNSMILNNGLRGVILEGASTLQSGITPTDALFMNNTIWGNRFAVVMEQNSTASLTNNLIGIDGFTSRVYVRAAQLTSVKADYNAYVRKNQGFILEQLVSSQPSLFYNRLFDWQQVSGQDAHSLSHEPYVVNPAAGDFHLRSVTARYLPNGSITNDPASQHSPLIDTGDPTSDFSREPGINGGRVNIGRYGNTVEASQSRTNAWLLALTLNDGGEIARTNIIRWTGGGWTTGATFRVEYAADGSSYSLVVASNLPASVNSLAWDVSAYSTVPAARWRVVNEQESTVFSATESTFAVKNEPLVIYVNDDSTEGDVYTSASGNQYNTGLSPGSPLRSPADAIDRFPLGPGDVVFIDTGDYFISGTNGIRIGLFGDMLKTGATGQFLRVVGSTNTTANGGSRISGPANAPHGLRIANAGFVSIENLTFSGTSNGVWVSESDQIQFTRVSATGNRVGFLFDQAVGTSFRYSSAWGNEREGIKVSGNRTTADFQHGVIWENGIAGVDIAAGSMSVSNSIVGVLEGGAPAYIAGSGGTLRGDFNLYWTGTNNVIAKPAAGGDVLTLRDWQTRRDMDHRSYRLIPHFVDASIGDFHLMSDEGRYDPVADAFVKDTTNSWAIDAGAFGDDFSQETAPNGGRVNIGLYGNTAEASRSSTNPALLAVSLDDGGLATNPQDLYWLARGFDSNATVRLEYTQNDGLGWSVVASNLPASPGVFTWNTSGLDSTPLGRWRVILEDDESISDETETPFYVRNGPIYYYVNDTNTVGDVYTLAAGAEEFDGITVTSPALRVSAILDRYDLDGSDGVFIDTGYYESESNIRILAADSGHATNRVFLQGSTNEMAGGSVFYRVPATNFSLGNVEAAFELTGPQYVEFSDLIITGANAGIYVNNTTPGPGNHLFRNIEIRDGGYYGIRMSGSGTNMLERVLVHRMLGYGVHATNSAPLFIDASVLWSNGMGGVSAGFNALRMTNSMIHAYGEVDNSAVSLHGTNGTFYADYNAYHIDGVASYYTINGEPFGGLPQLTQARTQEIHSISIEPQFADPGNGDFHIASPNGRWDPVAQAFVTNDVVFSYLLDAGAPGASFTNEPVPNGSRRNIGLYGDTAEASKSSTDPWIRVITAMAGGRIGGNIPLRWNYGNLDTTNRVNLEYSVDGGDSWLSIATNVAIDAGGYLWESLSYDPFRSPVAKWRILVTGDTNLVNETSRNFALNGPFQFYVNDGSTEGDVFTTAVGDDENTGIFSNEPKATLRAILDSWDIDPFDEILLDTGTYQFEDGDRATVRLDARGSMVAPVVIRGSTNGVVLDGALITNGSPVLLTINAPYVVLENVQFKDGFVAANASDVMMRRIEVEGGGVTVGGVSNTLEHYLLTNATLTIAGTNATVRLGRVNNGSVTISGRLSELRNTIVTGHSSPLVGVSGVSNAIVNNTLVGRATAIRQTSPGTATTVRNNIIVTDGVSGTVQVYDRQSGTLNSDYNLIQVRNGAWYGPADGGLWEKLLYWQVRTGQDLNSIAADPLFANEAAGDFHVKSVEGRYEAGSWVTDGVQSPAIDTGNPADAADGEPAPNGGRVNMGAYGNTEEASKGLSGPWVIARTMNDGGVIRGTNVLRWSSGNVSPTNRVTLEYSANGGANWTVIASGLNAGDGSYTWNTTTATSSLDGVWRVVLEGDPGIWDAPDELFALRNDVRQFYLNDGATGGDIYTAAPGSNAQDGRTPGTPKATLDHLFSVYDTEPGDTIYMDTGVYTSAVVQVIWSRSGTTNQPVTIQGSTNYAQGGTVLRRAAKSGDGLGIDASFIDVNNLTVENAARGIAVRTNRQVRLDQVELRGNDEGAVFAGGGQHRIVSSRVWKNALGGVRVAGVSNMVVENITFVDNTPYSVEASVTSNTVFVLQNNIFYHDVATSNSQFAIQGAGQTVSNAFIDYNIYYFGPWSASNTFIYTTNRTLDGWQKAMRKDLRGGETNPALQDVASGDLHVKSVYGRWDPGAGMFVTTDTNTSWAVDRGNPYSAYDREMSGGESGNRVNIGAYGNTPWASRSATNRGVVLETGAAPLFLDDGDTPYLIRWWLRDVDSVPSNLTYTIQFSGDGGMTWTNLRTGLSVFDEVYRWTNSPAFNTFKGKFRLHGEGTNSAVTATSEDVIWTFIGEHAFTGVAAEEGQPVRVIWRGAWGEEYRVFGTTNLMNTNAWTQLIATNLARGGDTVYTDTGATDRVFRVYRVLWSNTNDYPVP